MTPVKKYFGTDGIRGKVGASNINPEFVLKLGWAVGRVLVNGGRKKVLIGKDTRVSGYLLESALQAGLSAAGVDIQLLGPMPTPAIAYLTRTLRAQAGIVISASHNPYEDNGIKFFGADGRKLDDDIELAIEAQMEQPFVTVASADLGKAKRITDAPGRYIEFCKSTISSKVRLNGLKIVVDCANGATYHVAPDVFRELGAQVVAMNVSPDGFNINAECGSTNPSLLAAKVLAEHADLGIAFDGDGDRVIMVDHQGEVVDGDELLYIIAKDRLRRDKLYGGVVGTVMSNFGLELALKKLGIDFVRAAVGDRYVLAEMAKQNWFLGGEASGHIVFLNRTTTGDGIVAALQVLLAMHNFKLSLAEIRKDMVKMPQTMINISTDKATALMSHPDVQQIIESTQLSLNGSGRVLLRPSGTEPVIRIMVEGEDAQQINTLAQQVAEVIQQNA